MAFDWFASVYSPLNVACAAVWPEIIPPPGGGVWPDEEVSRLDFNTQGHPIAAIESIPAIKADMAITTDDYEQLVGIHYATRREQGLVGAREIQRRLDLMRVYLRDTGLGTDISVTLVQGMDWSLGEESLSRFIAARTPWVSGVIYAQLLVGEST